MEAFFVLLGIVVLVVLAWWDSKDSYPDDS